MTSHEVLSEQQSEIEIIQNKHQRVGWEKPALALSQSLVTLPPSPLISIFFTAHSHHSLVLPLVLKNKKWRRVFLSRMCIVTEMDSRKAAEEVGWTWAALHGLLSSLSRNAHEEKLIPVKSLWMRDMYMLDMYRAPAMCFSSPIMLTNWSVLTHKGNKNPIVFPSQWRSTDRRERVYGADIYMLSARLPVFVKLKALV